jgi:hypothetical protein
MLHVFQIKILTFMCLLINVAVNIYIFKCLSLSAIFNVIVKIIINFESINMFHIDDNFQCHIIT